MKRIATILSSAISALVLLSACHHKSAPAEEIPEVTVATPQTDSIVLHQSYPATIQAASNADVVGRVSGTLQKILYTEGDYVAAGQPLFTIESTTYRDRVNQAQATLETAQAELEYARKQYQAMQKALEADAVSKMDVIQAESNLKQGEASVKQARAALQTANTMLGYCTVRAPFSGKVSAATVSVGAYISGEESPFTLAKIYDDKKVHVMFSISTDRYMELTDTRSGKETDLTHVPVLLSDSIAGPFYGYLDYASPGVSKSTGTVTLRIIVDNPDGILRDGMFATVNLPYAVDPHALLIRDASISTDQLGKYVYTVNDSDKIVYTPIQVGELYQDTLRVVTGGLDPASRYVTAALLKVRDGMPVKPVETGAKPTAQTAPAAQTRK